jgi:hypothetical protein
LDGVRGQFDLAHAYRNQMTEVARGERAAKRDVIESYAAVRDATEMARPAVARRAAAAAAVAADHARSRDREHDPLLQAELDAARAEARAALIALDAARAAASCEPEARGAFEEISERANEYRRVLRKGTGVNGLGLYSGTYQIVEEAVDRALTLVLAPGKKISLPLWDGVDTRDPRFVGWVDGTHAVSVQVTGGASPDATDDTHWRLEGGRDLPAAQANRVSTHFQHRGRVRTSAPPARDPNSKRSQRLGFRTLALRIGSNPDPARTPVWARWPLVAHRPFPAGAIITRVTVQRETEGPNEHWTALFTVRVPEKTGVPATVGGSVAADIGWRVIGDALRVAVWVDARGTVGELRLNPHELSKLGMPDALRAIRDDRFNLERTWLVGWMQNHNIPDCMMERTKTIADWRSCGRLAALVLDWRGHRFDGDAEAFSRIEAWRQWDKIHWQWEASQRSKAMGHRKNLYRNYGVRLARQYDALVLEKFDLRTFAIRAPVDSPEADNETARHSRVQACLSELRGAFVWAFTRERRAVIDVDPMDSTHECHACGAYVEFDAAKFLYATCQACGTRWDQDENAARVLLARSTREGSGDANSPAIARKRKTTGETQGAWARRKAAKLAREEAARTARGDGENLVE